MQILLEGLRREDQIKTLELLKENTGFMSLLNISGIKNEIEKRIQDPKYAVRKTDEFYNKNKDSKKAREILNKELNGEKRLKAFNSAIKNSKGNKNFLAKNLREYIADFVIDIKKLISLKSLVILPVTILVMVIVMFFSLLLTGIIASVIGASATPIMIMTIAACIVAPIVEEIAKVMVSKMTKDGGVIFATQFALIEGIMYIIQGMSVLGPIIILLRIPALLMHIETGRFYDRLVREDKLTLMNVMRGIGVHMIFNTSAVITQFSFGANLTNREFAKFSVSGLATLANTLVLFGSSMLLLNRDLKGKPKKNERVENNDLLTA